MNVKYKEVLSEVYYIVSRLPQEEVSKIPTNFLDFIKNNRAKYYEVNIDFENDKDYKLQEETMAILAIIYRKFLASADEKVVLEKEFNEKLKRELEADKKIEANPKIEEKIEESTVDEDDEQIMDIIKYEEKKWYIKIIDKIKSLLRKNQKN